MKYNFIILILLVALVSTPSANASMVYYDSRDAFNTAAPDLPIEDFEEARDFGTMTGDLDKNTDNEFFIPGEILDGLRIRAEYFGDPRPLRIEDWGGSKVTGTYWYGDTLDLIFYNNNVTAVGVEIYEWPIGQEINIDIFGTNGLLDSFSFGSGSGFWGVISTEIITQISLSDDWLYPLTVDDIAFTPIPEPACQGDFDSDGDVDGSDLATFAANFGRTDCP